MSRHIIKGQIAGKEAVVVIGFDSPLQHYHMVVQLDGDNVWSNLSLEHGGVRDVDLYLFVLLGFGICLPEDMINELVCDRLECSGTNKIKDWGDFNK
jgi:hypothetical protein